MGYRKEYPMEYDNYRVYGDHRQYGRIKLNKKPIKDVEEIQPILDKVSAEEYYSYMVIGHNIQQDCDEVVASEYLFREDIENMSCVELKHEILDLTESKHKVVKSRKYKSEKHGKTLRRKR